MHQENMIWCEKVETIHETYAHFLLWATQGLPKLSMCDQEVLKRLEKNEHDNKPVEHSKVQSNEATSKCSDGAKLEKKEYPREA